MTVQVYRFSDQFFTGDDAIMPKAYALLAAGFLLLGAAACQAGDRKVISIQVLPDEAVSTPRTPVRVLPVEVINAPETPVEVIAGDMRTTPGAPVEIVPAEMSSAAETPMPAAAHELSCTTGDCGCQGTEHRSHCEALHEWLSYHHQRCAACRKCYAAPCCSPSLYLYFLCPDQWGHGAQGCASCANHGAVVTSGTAAGSLATVGAPETVIDSPQPVISSDMKPTAGGAVMYVASPQQINTLLSSGLPAGTVIMAVGPDGRPRKESAVILGR
jgi:hypothetical protein